jgi:hypothetical protein
MLFVGGALARSTDSASKAALRNAQSVNKNLGAPHAPPDFQFIGQGRIEGGAPGIWLIVGVPIQINDHTQTVGDIQAGDFVILSGRILNNGAWLADHLERSDGTDPLFTFNGTLETIGQEVWQVDGKPLLVNEQTQVDGDLAVDDLVLVTFTPLEDGSWLALNVEPFDEPWIEPTPTPTEAPASTESIAPAKKPAPAIIAAPKEKDKPSAKPKPAGNDDDNDEGDRGGDHDDDDHDHGGGQGDDHDDEHGGGDDDD